MGAFSYALNETARRVTWKLNLGSVVISAPSMQG